MKTLIFGLLLIGFGQISSAQTSGETAKIPTKAEQEILTLSKEKWAWMAEKNVSALDKLFDEQSVFVHMGGSWGKDREMSVIKGGGIWYKKAEVHDASVKIIENTAILLNRITLLAVVGGNEVTNPFIVTEVYVKKGGSWKMGSLSFTKVNQPGK